MMMNYTSEKPQNTQGWHIYLPSVLEHFGIGAVTLVIPRLVAQAAGLEGAAVESYCQIAMICVGIATLLQCWGWRGIGSGYLLPAGFAGIYLAPILAVATTDGLGAVAGLTIVAGMTQVVLSQLLRLMRGFIFHNVLGVTIVMIGISWGILGMKLMFGLSIGQEDAPLEWLPAVIALAIMTGISVWGTPAIRRLAVIVGLLSGCVVTMCLYPIFGAEVYINPDLSLAIPHWPIVEVTFTPNYILGFIIGAIASVFRVAGDVVASHNVSELRWKRPSLKAITAGNLSEGLANVISGFLGSIPVHTNTGSVGLVASSGVNDKRVAIGVGITWIALGILPFGPPLLLLIPDSIQGAAVFFTAGFVINAGLKVLAERKIDNRQSIMIGSAIIIGLTFDELMRELHMPIEVRTIFSSALLTSVFVAMLLNLLFRIGVGQTARFSWQPNVALDDVAHWFEEHARLWGARVAPTQKALSVIEELTLAIRLLSDEPVQIVAKYDETRLQLDFEWHGLPMPKSILVNDLNASGDPEIQAKLAAAVFRHHADHVTETQMTSGRHRVAVTIDDL